MSKINILPEELANQIAAGEVIERPVSVIDAGADRITIELTEGGKEQIKVTDNGSGIAEVDLPKTILKYATSKLHTKEDLFNIATLGFRGEALASIASVAGFTIISNDGTTSLQMQVEGGKVLNLQEKGHPRGTTVEIKQLFNKIPARLKFLKTASTEYSRILEYVKKLTLSSPEISFFLTHNQKETFRSQGIKNNKQIALKSSMSRIYGKAVLDGMLELSLTRELFQGWGLISGPEHTRADRKAINVFVNNRLVYSPIINKAIEEALRDILPGNRFPYLCCFLQIPYEQIDVNVHPQKKEVRFADSSQVFSFVNSLIKNAYLARNSAVDKTTAFGPTTFNTRIQKFSPATGSVRDFFPSVDQNDYEDTLLTPEVINQKDLRNKTTSAAALNLINQLEDPDNHSSMVVLGQANRSWIIALDADDLVIIDQHAAHERINYENLKLNKSQAHLTQGLLLPLQLELDSEQQETLSRAATDLKQLGFEFDLLQENNLILRGVPQNLKTDIDFQNVFLEILDDISETGSSYSSERLSEEVLKMTACKASVKAGENLTYMEMKQLIKDLLATDNYLSCPHGRPTIISITDEELRKRFHRS